jgi:hypothetical protein
MRRNLKRASPFSHYLEKKDEFNVLYPSDKLLSISPIHTLTPEVVLIDSDPTNGEVFQAHGSSADKFHDAFVIAKRGLEKIAWAAGIQFHPKYTRRTDDGRNPRRVEFQAVGSIQKPDGSWYSISRSKEVDLDALSGDIKRALEDEARTLGLVAEREGTKRRLVFGTEECASEISLRLEREVLSLRKNMVAMADSGAYSRVVRSLLNIRPTYTYEELQRPFVVPAVALDVEYLISQIWAKERFIKGGLTTTFNLFGPAFGHDTAELSVTPDEYNVEVGKKTEEGPKLTKVIVERLKKEDDRKEEAA